AAAEGNPLKQLVERRVAVIRARLVKNIAPTFRIIETRRQENFELWAPLTRLPFQATGFVGGI
ncbi:MAG: hypothetical protein L0H75_05325, partial [Nitrosospira sp.]|nr:hypothetical protein [Nitrosospira sp.]